MDRDIRSGLGWLDDRLFGLLANGPAIVTFSPTINPMWNRLAINGCVLSSGGV